MQAKLSIALDGFSQPQWIAAIEGSKNSTGNAVVLALSCATATAGMQQRARDEYVAAGSSVALPSR
jgi:hypothetical protein